MRRCRRASRRTASKTTVFWDRFSDGFGLLAKNLAYRARELALRGPSSSAKFTPPRTNTGTLVFTEIGGAKDEPPRVWVSRKGEPDAEEADAETARRHRLIARPPALLPRVKRNY